MNNLIYAVLAASILALVFAFVFFKQMMKKDEEATKAIKARLH